MAGWQRSADQPAFAKAALHDVTWTGTRFVTLSSDTPSPGLILDSDDGQIWHTQPLLETDAWTIGPDLLATGPSGVIGIGGGEGGPIAVWHSAEGLSWSRVADQAAFQMQGGAFEHINAAIATDAGWLAVGGGHYSSIEPNLRPIVLTSPDGLLWAREPDSAVPDHAVMNGIVRGPSGFVAVGAIIGKSPAGVAEKHPAVWTSQDGRTWSRSTVAPAFDPPAGSVLTPRTDVILEGIVVRGNRLVVVGRVERYDEASGSPSSSPQAIVWYSDGATWTQVAFESTSLSPPVKVNALPEEFLLIGGSAGSACAAGLWASTDGTAWGCLGNDPVFTGFGISGVAASPNLVVLVGTDNTPASTGSSAVWTMALH